METLRLTTVIGPDRKLRIEAPTHLDPGPAEVVVGCNLCAKAEESGHLAGSRWPRQGNLAR